MSIINFKDVEQQAEDEEPSRLVALSDAVFAVAITLLVLDIGVPKLDSITGAALDKQLVHQLQLSGREVVSYIISFLVIGVYWRAHHQIFKYIKRSDQVLAYLNLILLMVIAFLPVPTGYIGDYGSSPVAVLLYAPIIALTGLLLWSIWFYASQNHRLIDRDLDPAIISYYRISFLIAPVIYLLSIPLIYLNVFSSVVSGPDLAKYFWILTLPAHRIFYRSMYSRQVSIQAAAEPSEQQEVEEEEVKEETAKSDK
jgi:uncharacterized membrane protein